MFNIEQKRNAFKKLSSEEKDFVMSENTTNTIEGILNQSGFNNEQSDMAHSEIFNALLNLQSLSQAIEKIALITGKQTDGLIKLQQDLEQNIFKDIQKINRGEKNTEKVRDDQLSQANISTTLKTRTRMAPVGFEEAILNQARAMRTAIPPENLPTQNAEPHKIHNYTSGADPYREPTE